MIEYEGWERGGIRHEALVLIQFDITLAVLFIKMGRKERI